MVLALMATPGPVGTPVPLSTFGVPAANNINEIITDLTPVLSAWTTYTPTWTSNGTAPAIGNGTLSGRYVRLGKVGFAVIQMIIGSTTTVGTLFYAWGLPPGWTAATNPAGSAVIGVGRVTDVNPPNTSTSFIGAVNVASGGTTVTLGTHGATTGVGQTVPITFSNTAPGQAVIMELKMELA